MGQGLLSFNFKYIPKAEQLGFLFFLSCFAKFGWRKPAENLALVDVGWRQECIYFIYLPVFTGEALRQNSKAMAVLPAACRQEERSPPPNPFFWHQQDQHRRYVTESAMQMPSNVCFIRGYESEQRSVRASYPAPPDKSAVTSEETKHSEIPLSRLLRAPITHWHQQHLFYCNSCHSMCRLFFILNPTCWSQKMLRVFLYLQKK